MKTQPRLLKEDEMRKRESLEKEKPYVYKKILKYEEKIKKERASPSFNSNMTIRAICVASIVV